MIKVEGQSVHIGSSEKMRDIKDGSVDFLITSPPYWDLKKYGQHPEQIGASSYEEYLSRLGKVLDEAYRVAKDGSLFFFNINSRRNKGVFYPIAFDIYKHLGRWKLWDVLIWYIPNALPQSNGYMERLFDNKFEYVLILIKGDSKKYKFHKPRVPQKYATADPRRHKLNIRGRCLGNIVRIPAYRPPNVKQMGYHVAAFPEELVALALETCTDPNDTVLDPFLGSGTTLKVCRVMGRKGIGYEINPGYEKLIHCRIAEPWKVPDWRKIDLIHSTTTVPGQASPRKIQFHAQPPLDLLFR